MKKLIIFLLIAVMLTGSIYAQNRNRQGSNNHQRENNSVTVNGTLRLEKGLVAVQGESADSVYLIPTLNRFIGFINGLSEGKSVTVEGTRFRNVIQPSKITIDGRTYDFSAYNKLAFENRGQNQRWNNQTHDKRNYRQNPKNKQKSGGCCSRRGRG